MSEPLGENSGGRDMVSDNISVSSESQSAGRNGWLRVRQCGDTPVHTTEALLPQGETVLDKFTKPCNT